VPGRNDGGKHVAADPADDHETARGSHSARYSSRTLETVNHHMKPPCQEIRATLRAALTYAVKEDELIHRNVATMVRLPAGRVRKIRAWSVTEACQFLESARADNDPVYTGYVLMLVLGLRLGEVLGLPWASVNLDVAEVDVSWQLQRVGKQLHHRETKTPGSDAPLPAICAAAFKVQPRSRQAGAMMLGRHGTTAV
jgi:site-specific recombinase XerC